MSVRTELSDLIRAMARRDWGTVDRLVDAWEKAGWTGGVQMIGAAFAILVNRRFSAGHTPTDVARFVTETRAQFPGADELPTLEMEGLVRAALGEPDLAESINLENALQIQIVVLGKLLQDEELTEPQLEEFIGEVERTAAEYM
ncbi:hypothetical protein AB0J86_09495 [Micromonospora sp. NPDC049559]|uniref:hypothetical protein n=1 Tax=Micromonospora sp. NPDC049559 TaxID=3155923 RepID=UPI00341760DD